MQTAFAVRPDTRSDRTNLPLERGQAGTRYSIDRVSIIQSVVSADGSAPIVFIVDHEPFIHESLDLSGRRFGWQIRRFHSARAFLESPPILSPSCLVLNVAMPDLDVLELQERVATDRPGMPIILITGTGGPTMVQARSAGTVKLFVKPVRDELLMAAVANALERGRPAFIRWAHTRRLRSRYDALSRRERQIMDLVITGRLNKQVAGELGISEITVKAHRGKVMRKMQAASLPSLVTMAARLGLAGPDDGSF